jgi:putative oxidoreductase
MSFISKLINFYYKASHLPECLAPLVDLGLRLYLADVFFKSGLTKIKNWDSTLYLFSDVYQVPLLNTDVAAYLATSVELGCSILLLLGLFGRFAASGLFILNLVAVISYADLSQAGINQHLSWGILLGVLLILSHGKLSIDAWLEKIHSC